MKAHSSVVPQKIKAFRALQFLRIAISSFVDRKILKPIADIPAILLKVGPYDMKRFVGAELGKRVGKAPFSAVAVMRGCALVKRDRCIRAHYGTSGGYWPATSPHAYDRNYLILRVLPRRAKILKLPP